MSIPSYGDCGRVRTSSDDGDVSLMATDETFRCSGRPGDEPNENHGVDLWVQLTRNVQELYDAAAPQRAPRNSPSYIPCKY